MLSFLFAFDMLIEIKLMITLHKMYILYLTLFERDKTWAICTCSFWKYKNLKKKASLLNGKIIPLKIAKIAFKIIWVNTEYSFSSFGNNE